MGKWKWEPNTCGTFGITPVDDCSTWTASCGIILLEVEDYGGWLPTAALRGTTGGILRQFFDRVPDRRKAQRIAEKAVPELLLGAHLAIVAEMKRRNVAIPNDDDPDVLVVGDDDGESQKS